MNLSGEQYWKWRFLIKEMELKKAELKESHIKVKLCESRTKIQAYEAEKAQRSLEEAKRDYEDYKKQIEDDLEISLNNKVIDDYTYEVKDINSQGGE